MKYIGFRTTKKSIVYCIYDSNIESIIFNDKIVIPKKEIMDYSSGLRFIRYHIIDILNYHKIDYAGIKTEEINSKEFTADRLWQEGVIQEAISNSEVKGIKNYRKKTIESKLDLEDYEKATKNKKNKIRLIKNYTEIKEKASKEAALTALTLTKEEF